jgi:hypothetical protein
MLLNLSTCFGPMPVVYYSRVMPAMRVGEFLAMVQERALGMLPDHARDGLTSRVSSSWLWVHYHHPKVHFEVWLARKIGRIEIGLHFEGPREFSYRWAEAMAPYMPEIQARLGPQMELEEWTASWTRVHQTVPYDPLSEPLADEVARRFAETIAVLQPIVERERENVPVELERSREPIRTNRKPRRRPFKRGGANVAERL